MLKNFLAISAILLICLQGAAQCSVDLGPDANFCPGDAIDLSINVQQVGDSLRITYDAALGQSGLVGANKVYFHSGAELVPFGGWQYPIGDWGQDNGVGQMSPLGNDKWQITILPESYYGYPSSSSLNGIFMVFRNADGSQTGKDDNGNDIFLDMSGSQPSSAFGGVAGELLRDPIQGILWSTGASGNQISVAVGGTYWVEVVDSAGCVARDSIEIGLGALPLVDLGPAQVICDGQPVQLDAGAGFSSYEWNTGAQTQSLTVSTAGLYTVTVTNADGCEGADVLYVDAAQFPTAAFALTVGNAVSFQNNSQGGDSYAWDFDGNGTVDDTTANPANWTPPGPGVYETTLVVSNGCGSDTAKQTVTVAVSLAEAWRGLNGRAWVEGAQLLLEFDFLKGGLVEWEVLDLWGRRVKEGSAMVSPGKWREGIELLGQGSGVYCLVLSQGGSMAHFKFILANQ